MVKGESVLERLNTPANILYKGFGKAQNSSPDRPEFLKELQVGLTIQGERNKDIADAFDTTPESISQIKNGNNLSTQSKERLSVRKTDAQTAALDKLISSLNLLDDDKLKACKARDLASIASDMSKVVERMKEDKFSNGGNTLIIYAPAMKKERDFEVIDI